MSQRRGVAGNALSTPAARAAAAAPAAAIAAGAGSHRTPGGPRRAAQPAVRRPVAHRGSCHVARGADLPLLPAHDVVARAARTGWSRADPRPFQPVARHENAHLAERLLRSRASRPALLGPPTSFRHGSARSNTRVASYLAVAACRCRGMSRYSKVTRPGPRRRPALHLAGGVPRPRFS